MYYVLTSGGNIDRNKSVQLIYPCCQPPGSAFFRFFSFRVYTDIRWLKLALSRVKGNLCFAGFVYMKQFHLLVINGPNLGVLGLRQPEIYGREGMADLPDMVAGLLGSGAGEVRLSFYQSNHEGALIDRLEAAREEGIDGLIFNAGALTHTSLALGDCLAWLGLPCVEVHLSNVMARADKADGADGMGESLRKISFLARHCLGLISGFGLFGYALAVQALIRHLKTDGVKTVVC